jgi:hypothetical protein
MTLGELIPDVRRLVRDTDAELRHYADDAILAALVDGVEALRSANREARYVCGVLTDLEWPDAADLASFDPHIRRQWRLGVCYFAAGRMFETDTVDTVNAQMAAEMFKKAAQEFIR